jgi:hypothetical protein
LPSYADFLPETVAKMLSQISSSLIYKLKLYFTGILQDKNHNLSAEPNAWIGES